MQSKSTLCMALIQSRQLRSFTNTFGYRFGTHTRKTFNLNVVSNKYSILIARFWSTRVKLVFKIFLTDNLACLSQPSNRSLLKELMNFIKGD